MRVGLISGVGGTALHSQGRMAVCRRGVYVPTTGRRPQHLLAADGASRLERWPPLQTAAQLHVCPAQFRNPSITLVGRAGTMRVARGQDRRPGLLSQRDKGVPCNRPWPPQFRFKLISVVQLGQARSFNRACPADLYVVTASRTGPLSNPR